MNEGFDDSGEEGCGEKLLHLLQKMGVENILILVCIWHNSMPGQYGTDTYKRVIERAKDLLTTLHQKVLDSNAQVSEVNNEVALFCHSKKGKNINATGNLLATKVYPSGVIPINQNLGSHNASVGGKNKNFRPNNFLNDQPAQQVRPSMEHEADEDQLEIELTEDEFNYAVKMTEHSIRRLTKAHIIELRNQVKPHPLIERVLNMVCILRGCIAPNWTVARELMQSMTFKMELMLMDVCNIKNSLIKKVIRVLNNYQKQLTPDSLAQISEGASILLIWIINLVKWNAGHNKYKFNEVALGGHKIMNNQL